MGKQQFLNGGFYGKVGQVIGERWKKLRYVKSYAVPFNPRTEKQQANRELFARATKLAQIAQMACYNSTLYPSDEKPVFSQRVSQAFKYLQNKAASLNAIPLIPDKTLAISFINKAALITQPAGSPQKIEIYGTLPKVTQKVSILAQNTPIFDENQIYLMQGEILQNEPNVIKITNDGGFFLKSDDLIRITSAENPDLLKNRIASNELTLSGEPMRTENFNTNVASRIVTAEGVLITFQQRDGSFNAAAENVSTSINVYNKKTDINRSILSLQRESDKWQLLIPYHSTNEWEKPYLAIDTVVTIGKISVASSTTKYVSENVTLTLQKETDVRTEKFIIPYENFATDGSVTLFENVNGAYINLSFGTSILIPGDNVNPCTTQETDSCQISYSNQKLIATLSKTTKKMVMNSQTQPGASLAIFRNERYSNAEKYRAEFFIKSKSGVLAFSDSEASFELCSSGLFFTAGNKKISGNLIFGLDTNFSRLVSLNENNTVDVYLNLVIGDDEIMAKSYLNVIVTKVDLQGGFQDFRFSISVNETLSPSSAALLQDLLPARCMLSMSNFYAKLQDEENNTYFSKIPIAPYILVEEP